MKKILPLFLIILLGVIFYWNWDKVEDLYLDFFQKISEAEKAAIDFSVKEIEKKVSMPGPLRAPQEFLRSFLTKAGVIQWTNIQRKANKLTPLLENIKLNASAGLKLQDMFEKQYFAHVSPLGTGAADLVKEVSYEFVMTGENIALGNFKDDQDLVQSWMDSPGHRENILNERYQEIGVAVAKGMFEGQETWLAVQIFGLPLSVCPQPDEDLQAKIELYQNQLNELQKNINLLKTEIEAMYPKRGPVYNQKVKEHNNYVEQYNKLADKVKGLVSEYNIQIKLFNECVAGG